MTLIFPFSSLLVLEVFYDSFISYTVVELFLKGAVYSVVFHSLLSVTWHDGLFTSPLTGTF